MYVYTQIVIDLTTGNVIDHNGFSYDGPVALCKGASQEQKDQAKWEADLAKKEGAFYDTMSAAFSKMFEGSTAILKSLTDAFTPILKAGPDQFAFTKAEEAARRTQASEAVGSSYRMAKQATAEERATSDVFIPKGADQEVNAQMATVAASDLANRQLGITEQGYQLGRDRYNQAAAALGGVAGLMNPTGYAGATTGAASSAGTIGQDAAQQYSTIYEENKSTSPWNVIGGIIGGAASAFTGGLSTVVGKAVGSRITG